MRIAPVASCAALAALALGAAAEAQGEAAGLSESFDAANLELVRVVGAVEIETGGVDRISVDYDPGEGLLPAPDLAVEGDTLRITGLSRWTDISCRGRDGELLIEVEDAGRNPIADYGVWHIRLPEGARVEISEGAVDGVIGDTGSLDIDVSSCGDIAAGAVAGDVSVAVNGSGSLEVEAVAGALSVAINGSGDVTTGPVGGAAAVGINGSGDVETASADGGLLIAINGSGEVVSGAVAKGLDVAINGSGDVEIASVTGDIRAAIAGSGDIRILGGEVETLEASMRGSGDIAFEGAAKRVHLGN
jgi:hypothetical protein